jgi:hypothetical protein
MRRVLPISCVVLALTVSAALAGGLNLSWGPECASDATSINKNFACTSDSGSSTMVVSFAPSSSHEHLIAVDAVIDGVDCLNPVVPDWWQFKNTGACRIDALSTNSTISENAVICLDAWGGQGTPTITYYGDPVWVGTPTPPVQGNRARIKVGCLVPVAVALGVEEEREYFLFNVVVNHTKTVGPEYCTGCLVPMIWVLNSIMPGYQDGVYLSSEVITMPMVNQLISWQGAPTYWEPNCTVATLNKTWGQIKSLYR